MTAYRIELIGADALIRRLLERDTWFNKPVKRALAKIGQQGRAAAKAVAPVGPTGRLKATITYRVNTKLSAPRFVAIATRANRLTGKNAPFPYPRILEFGRHQGKGVFGPSRHKGWLLAAIQGIRGSMESALQAAGREIEQAWNLHRGGAG